jgi:hypothetical protein
MPRLTGTVAAAGKPVAWGYVQVRNPRGDFQGEVRTDGDGRFVLHPSPGEWRLVAWSPGRGSVELPVAVGAAELDVHLDLAERTDAPA